MKIYVASSWRNEIQDVVVATLRQVGHEVYDFKHPSPDNKGFAWAEIDPEWKDWTASAYRKALEHSRAVEGFGLDMAALRWCEACVLVLPCGRSAHLELGWAAGAGKKTIAYAPPQLGRHEPELMYKKLDGICVSIHEVIEKLREWEG